MNFVWEIPIAARPDRLWRYIADTNKVNQYAGLPEFTFVFEPDPSGGSRQIGETRYMGWRLRWDEHPFEWIEGRYFEVVRTYHNGPLREFRTAVELEPHGEGTLVRQTLRCEPRWTLTSPIIWWEIGVQARRRFTAAYRKIETHLAGLTDAPLEPSPREAIPEGRLSIVREKLANAEGGESLDRLVRAIETLPPDALDRMRPFLFADLWKVDRRRVLKLFLRASQAGLLDLSWDVVCPGCRGAPERWASLRQMRKEAHCPACNIRYTADFAQSVEVTFRPNPLIRRIEAARYCSGGPMNAPHIVAQQRIAGRSVKTIELELRPWEYHVRSAKLDAETVLFVRVDAGASRARLSIRERVPQPETLALTPSLTLDIENTGAEPLVFSIERAAGNADAATAATVIAMQEFRTLFSEEILSPDNPISVGAVTLLFTDLKSSTALYESYGEAPAYGLVQRHFDLLAGIVSQAEGAIVKTIGDAVMAVFIDPAKALEAAFAMHRGMIEDNVRRGDPALDLKIGIHHGPCITVNQNEALDYFGTTVNVAARIQKESAGGDVAVTEEVWRDPRVQAFLAGFTHTSVLRDCELRGISRRRRLHIVKPSFS